MHNQW